MPNVFEPEWDAERDEPPYRWRRARLARQAGLERLGASLFELPPGAASFPLHAHLHNEEAIVVLRGRPTLRTLDGERVLEPGEVVGCPAGRAGAHRLDNAGDEPVRVLVISTMCSPPRSSSSPTRASCGCATTCPGPTVPRTRSTSARGRNTRRSREDAE